MYIAHSWNDDRGQLMYLEKSLSQCYFIHHKYHMDWQRIATGPLLILYRLRIDSNTECAQLTKQALDHEEYGVEEVWLHEFQPWH